MMMSDFKQIWDAKCWGDFDPRLSNAVQNEIKRQQDGLELIASENYVSERVLQASGSLFTNKYAEGYPGKRYYGGCEFYDDVENYAIELANQLFGSSWANVQPHSGANANFAVFYGLLNPGDTILGMDLAQGGHLTHGSPVSVSGKWFKAVSYGLTEAGLINFDQVREVAKREKPKLMICGATCYPRIIDFKTFSDIAKEVGAVLLADISHISGLVAGGVHPSPLPHVDIVTSTTHKTLRGPRGGMILGNDPDLFKKCNRAVFPGTQGGPLMQQVLAKAVCFKEALTPEFKTYATHVIKNAQALAKGIMAGGYDVISGGTDNHLIWMSLLKNKDLDGKMAQRALEEAGITVNKNAIPNEPRSFMVTSGIRLGSPALTTRGLREAEMEIISKWISEVLDDPIEKTCTSVRKQVENLCLDFPIYSGA
jgi:glycine hydroxymethyltransferase